MRWKSSALLELHYGDYLMERIELTFHNNQLTTRYLKKRAKSRRQPTSPAGNWWLASPHQLDTDADTNTSSPTRPLYGAGGDTTTAADTTRHCKRLHHTWPHPENSYHWAITNHQEACHTTFYSRQPAEEENKTEHSARADQRPQRTCREHLLGCVQQAVPSAGQVQPPRSLPTNIRGLWSCDSESTMSPTSRRNSQRGPTRFLRVSPGARNLVFHQGTNIKALLWRVLHGEREEDRDQRDTWHHLLVRLLGTRLQGSRWDRWQAPPIGTS